MSMSSHHAGCIRLQPFEYRGQPVAAAGTHSFQRAATVEGWQLMRERCQHPDTGGIERMPDQDSAATRVHTRIFGVHSPILETGEYLHGKGLVELDNIDI
jgi:hypothetical protein